jgi:cation-transporting ATPase 13A3/4/5
MWLQCPIPPDPEVTFTEPIFLAFYGVISIQALLFSLWFGYKTYAEATVPRPPRPQSKANVKVDQGTWENDSENSDDPSLLFSMEGFKNNFVGTILYFNTHLVSIAWLLVLAIIVADYYAGITGVAYGVFFYSDMSSKIFVTVWVFTSVWLVINNFYQERMRNAFRIRCLTPEADVIQIERKPDSVVMMENEPQWLSNFKKVQSKLTTALGSDLQVETSQISKTHSGRKYFDFRCTRYLFNETSHQFEPYSNNIASTHSELLDKVDGLTTKAAENELELYGPNFIPVYIPPIWRAFVREFSEFFYLYQMMCLWIWYYFAYFKMGLVQTAVILVSAVIRVYLKVKSEKHIKSLAEYSSTVEVKRDGEWAKINSKELVPGDVFAIEDKQTIPCDAVLLHGEVIVDESMLTGEAMPVRKLPIPNDRAVYHKGSTGKINTLISGTAALQVNAGEDSKQSRAIALCLSTGINTDKGTLVQRILFPSEISFVFNDHLKLVVIVLLCWGIIGFALSLYFMGRGDITSWFYGMFVISQIMSPLLPSALVCGQSVAAGRLRKEHNINCVDLPRIMVAGKVKTFCFDKTGTLTKEGLNLQGFLPNVLPTMDGCEAKFQSEQISSKDLLQLPRLIQMGLASSHTVTVLDGEFIGNPVDVELVKWTQWDFKDTEANSPYLNTFAPNSEVNDGPIHVVQRFPFVHARATMSVLIFDPSTGSYHIYVKGSFEKIVQLSSSDSVPSNFAAVTNNLAKQGCYVLGLGHRELGPLNESQLEQVLALSRDEIETGLNLLGLISFRNELKDDTTKAIDMLHCGGTKTIMITGDNAYTGIYIARTCGMVAPGAKVYLAHSVTNSDAIANLTWTDVDTDSQIEFSKLKSQLNSESTPIQLAMTGAAFDHLNSIRELEGILDHCKIFARMTPEGKVQCVEQFMARSVTGMCGDGGNDCGALRAAHVGIALSEAEASVVSPFSAKDRSVMSCVNLLRHGRTALASSFAAYKFLILYGEIMCWLELTQFYFSVVVNQNIWIMVDGFVTVTMMASIALARPAQDLSPTRPTAKLLGAQTIVSAVSQVFFNSLTLIIAICMLFRQTWYKCNEFEASAIDSAKWWLLGDNYEAEIIGLVCLYQFVNSAAVFNFGHRYRASWWRNYPLVFCYVVYMAIIFVLTLANPNSFSCIFRVNCGTSSVLVAEPLNYSTPSWYIQDYNNPIGHNVMPMDFRWKLFALCICNCLINLLIEYFVILKFDNIYKWMGFNDNKTPTQKPVSTEEKLVLDEKVVKQ